MSRTGLSPLRLVLALIALLAGARLAAAAPPLEAGDLDPTFADCGVATTSAAYLWDLIAVQPDGKIVTSRQRQLARFLVPSGTLDPSFGGDGVVDHQFPFASGNGGLRLQPDGRILIPWGRFHADGTLDVAFETAIPYAEDVAQQADGKIVVGGVRLGPTGHVHVAVARYDREGVLDRTFGTDGVGDLDPEPASTDPELAHYVSSMAVQADDRIVVVGSSSRFDSFTVVRFLPGGAPDPEFGVGGVVSTPIAPGALAVGIAIDTDGTILVAGNGTRGAMTVVRHRNDGTRDDAFGVGGIAAAKTDAFIGIGVRLALQADRKIVMVGHGAMARLMPDGSLDASFGIGGIVTAGSGPISLAVAIPPDGQIVTAGDLVRNGNHLAAVARYEDEDDTGVVNTCTRSCDRTACGDGLLDRRCEVCDAGRANGTLTSCCSATCELQPRACATCLTCNTDFLCVEEPRTDCTAPSRPQDSTLRLDDAEGARADRLRWQWRNGRDGPELDFGRRDYDGLTMCLYDESATETRVVWRAHLPASPRCGDRSCWRNQDLVGSIYRDRRGDADGIVGMLLRNGSRGAGAIVATAGGPNLELPPLPLGLPLRMQLRSGNGRCWETRYDAAGTGRNDAHRFRAVGR